MTSVVSPGGCFIKQQLRTIVFIDGQNLYHGAKEAWRPQPAIGPSRYSWPSYDVQILAMTLTSRISGRLLSQIRFYTGVPDANQDIQWHNFWTNKLRFLKNCGIETYKGRINNSGQEKGVDVSIAIDLVRLTYEQQFEVAIIVSQDWDFGPAIALCKNIASNQQRRLVFESHFPVGPGTQSHRGIPGTIWCPI
ncbi:MAG: NYN domain-containing protein, partial [Chloroflexota bacterium]